MITALIVDDEVANRNSLRKLLKQHCPTLHLLGEAGTLNEAYELIVHHSPQLVFLDIELEKETAFDLLKKLDEVNFKVIFVTAHSEYAIKAFKFSAIDYLLKPVVDSDLIVAVNKAVNEINFNHQLYSKGLLENLNATNGQKLAIPIANGLIFLSPDEVIRLEADVNYTYIFSNGQKFTAARTIKDYELILNEHHFFRIHKSHLINLKHVKQFSRVDGYFVEMSDGSVVEISRRKKDEFVAAMSLH